MNLTELREFLVASNKAGYAGGEEKKWIKEPDGSTTIPYEKGDWKSHDNFFGGACHHSSGRHSNLGNYGPYISAEHLVEIVDY